MLSAQCTHKLTYPLKDLYALKYGQATFNYKDLQLFPAREYGPEKMKSMTVEDIVVTIDQAAKQWEVYARKKLLEAANKLNLVLKPSLSGIDLLNCLHALDIGFLDPENLNDDEWSIKNDQSSDKAVFEAASISSSAGMSGWQLLLSRDQKRWLETSAGLIY